MSVKILKLDAPTPNGRIYPESEIVKALEYLGTEEVYGEIQPDMTVDRLRVDEISHKVSKLRIEDGWLVGDVSILNTPKGNMLSTLSNSGLDVQYTLTSIGKVNESMQISDIKIIAIDASVRPE